MSPFPDGANVNVLIYVFAHNSVIDQSLLGESVSKKISSRENLLIIGIIIL